MTKFTATFTIAAGLAMALSISAAADDDRLNAMLDGMNLAHQHRHPPVNYHDENVVKPKPKPPVTPTDTQPFESTLPCEQVIGQVSDDITSVIIDGALISRLGPDASHNHALRDKARNAFHHACDHNTKQPMPWVFHKTIDTVTGTYAAPGSGGRKPIQENSGDSCRVVAAKVTDTGAAAMTLLMIVLGADIARSSDGIHFYDGKINHVEPIMDATTAACDRAPSSSAWIAVMYSVLDDATGTHVGKN